VTLFENVFNPARASDGGNPPNKFAAECHEVERDIDRFGLGLNAKHAAGRVELSLIHDDVLPHPALAASPRPFLACLAGATSQIHLFIDVCHVSPICMNRIIHLYARVSAASELTVLDLLTRPGPDLSAAEREEVKKVARPSTNENAASGPT